MSLAPKRLAVFVLALGVLPLVIATTEAKEISCEWQDGTRSCLDQSEQDAVQSEVSRLSQSLLQVSRPQRASAKVQLPQTEDLKATKGEKKPSIAKAPLHNDLAVRSGLSGHNAAAHDVHRHRREAFHSEHAAPGLELSATPGLSFIQTDDAVLEFARVNDVSVDEGSALPMEEVHDAWLSGFANVAFVGSAALLLAWSLVMMSSSCSRSSWKKVGKKVAASIPHGIHGGSVANKTVEVPEPEVFPASEAGFKEPQLVNTATSFAIPLTHHLEGGSSKSFRFNIPRRPGGPPISALVTCQPEGSTWAKVQLFAGEGGGGTSPLVSCCLVNSHSDDESRNIQGAMMSWLSLLMNEKEGAQAAAVVTTPRGTEIAGPPQQRQPRVRTCLHGIAEDLIAAGSAGSGGGSMRLEVRDSLGSLAGYLEAGQASKPGHFVLSRQGETILDIEAKPDNRSISLSKQGEVRALATCLGSRRDPELPELTGDEEDHIQVDIREGADWQESTLMLTCTLAMIVFKPQGMAREPGFYKRRPNAERLTSANTEEQLCSA